MKKDEWHEYVNNRFIKKKKKINLKAIVNESSHEIRWKWQTNNIDLWKKINLKPQWMSKFMK